jgi:hypothetical protein
VFSAKCLNKNSETEGATHKAQVNFFHGVRLREIFAGKEGEGSKSTFCQKKIKFCNELNCVHFLQIF